MSRYERTPAKARWLGDLRQSYQDALLRIHAPDPVLVSNPKINPTTLRGLKAHGLIEQGHNARLRKVWKLTARGRELVEAEEVRVLGYTARGHDDYADPEDRRTAMGGPLPPSGGEDEPEPVDRAEQLRQANDARTAAAIARDARTRRARALLAAAIAELSEDEDLSGHAAERLARMRRDYIALDAELRAS